MILSLPLRLFWGSVLAVLFALSVWSSMVLARLDESIFHPNSIRLAIAAGFAWIAALAYQQPIRLPSLRAWQAALVLGLLAYVLSTLLMFQSLRVLPSGAVAFCFGMVPVLSMLGYASARGRFLYAILAVGAMATYFVGIEQITFLRGNVWLSSAILLGALFSYLTAIWLTKKIFWLYSSWELTFWALLSAAAIHFLLGLVAGESPQFAHRWPQHYWIYLLGSSLVGALFLVGYRIFAFRLGRGGSAVLCAGIPLVGLALGLVSWQETPVNMLVLAATAVGICVLIFNGFYVKQSLWLSHALYNDIRKGDRLVTHLEGFLSGENISSARVLVLDISLGGIGAFTEGSLEVGQTVMLDLPLSTSGNQITLECQVVHHHPSKDNDLPLFVGLVWGKMSSTRSEDVVEFLAKTGRADL